MRKLVIVNGPNNNFYGIRNKGQYGNQSGCKIPLVLNPGAFTHYSYAIKDALESVHTLIPAIEVHMSNIHGRDDFRHISVTASECLGQIAGMGKHSYKIAMEAFKQMIEEGQL